MDNRLNRGHYSGKVLPLMARKLLLVVLLLSAAGVVRAQKSIKVDIDLVMVNVAVTDSENHVITDLKPENFQLFEDKVEQKIQYFSSEVAPVSLGIVFDISHSMEDKLELARAAAVRFLETGTPEDEYFLVEFSNRAEAGGRLHNRHLTAARSALAQTGRGRNCSL